MMIDASTVGVVVDTVGHNGVIAQSAITNSTWNHVVISYKSNTLKLYLNNVLVSSDNSGSGNLVSGKGTTVSIGRVAHLLNPSYLGKIDQLCIWNRELIPAEVTKLNNSGDGKAYPFN